MALPAPGAAGCTGNVLPLLIRSPGCRKGILALPEALPVTLALLGHISGAGLVSVVSVLWGWWNELGDVTLSERAECLN